MCVILAHVADNSQIYTPLKRTRRRLENFRESK